jgi:hypothetical protein
LDAYYASEYGRWIAHYAVESGWPNQKCASLGELLSLLSLSLSLSSSLSVFEEFVLIRLRFVLWFHRSLFARSIDPGYKTVFFCSFSLSRRGRGIGFWQRPGLGRWMLTTEKGSSWSWRTSCGSWRGAEHQG